MIGTIVALTKGCITNFGDSKLQQKITFSSDFESGRIGIIRQLEGPELAYELSLRDDNNNPSLPNAKVRWCRIGKL